MTVHCQQGKGTQTCGCHNSRTILCKSLSVCTEKGQSKIRGLLQISQQGWSLKGKYHFPLKCSTDNFPIKVSKQLAKPGIS